MNQDNKKTEIWKKASEVYAEISELSATQALAHIYGIENITAEVRKAVITLINSGSQASKYFQENITPHYNIGINNAQSFKVGQHLDEYELLQELGHGGMSQVFKARRINSEPQTHVAIKIFAPRENSKELFNHFINEQKILSELSHPHIVKMLHGGMTDDQTAYLVMELIEQALPLDEYCKNQSTRKKIKLIVQCADALAYSHANLIIHRDLKPDNILVNQTHQLKIVDFGIAKLINNDLSGNKTTIMALTPSYAAPEQINSGQISVKTDIFSLAVVALDLLIKGTPLPKDRLIKSCANDEQQIDKALKTLNSDKDLKNILRKALEQNPDSRYSSMQSFVDDLNNWLQYKPVNATSQSFIYRVKKFAHRRTALFATLVSFVTFLFIGSILGYQQYKQIKIEAKKAEVVKQFMLDSFSQTNPDISKGVEITAKDLLRGFALKLNTENNLDPQIQFELLQTLGIAYGALGNPQKAVELLTQSLLIKPNESRSTSYMALYLLDTTDGDSHSQFLDSIDIKKLDSNTDKARVMRVKAQVHARNSELDKAMIVLNNAIELNKFDDNKTEELSSIRILAEFYFRQSKPQKSIDILKKTLARTNDKTPLTMLIGLKNDLGKIYNDTGKYKLAINLFDQNIIKIRSIIGNKNPELSQTLIEISFAYKRLGMIEKAQTAADESYQINLDLYGKNSIQIAHSLNVLAAMAYQNGDTKKAIELFYKSVKIFELQQTEDYTDTLEVKTNLGLLLGFDNRNEEALIVLREVYELQKEKLGIKHNATIRSQQVLARTLSELNQSSEAITLAMLSMKNAKTYLDKNHPEYVGALYTLTRIYKNNEQYQKALGIAIEIESEGLLDKNEPNYHILLALIAQLYIAIDNFEKGDEYYAASLKNITQLYSIKHIRALIIQLEYAKFLLKNNQHEKAGILATQAKNIIIEEKIQNSKIDELIKSLN